MPVKTWVMLDSRNFTEDERIYMPLNLEGPSAGGILRIRGTLLYSPPPPIPPPPPPTEISKELLLESPDLIRESISEMPTGETTITVPGGTIVAAVDVVDPTWMEEPVVTSIITPEPIPIIEVEPEIIEPIIDPKIVVEEKIIEPITTIVEPIATTVTRSTTVEPITTTSTVEPRFGIWPNFFSSLKSFIAPPIVTEAPPQSTINIWMGPGSTLVYSARHSGPTFNIAVPINFFQDVVLIETACGAPPIGLGGREDIVAMEYSNPYELGVFAIPQDTIETTSDISSTIAVSSTMPKLRSGYHSCFVEVVTHGNHWNLHIEMEYDYERLGSALTYEEAPILRNILINKIASGLSRVVWQTNVICDRNWVAYGIHEAGENIVEATTGSLTPGANITMKDETWYFIKVFSELKGRVSNCEEFNWMMPDASIRRTADLTPKSNSAAVIGDGLQGDGIKVTDIEGKQELIRKPASIMPLLAVGGAAVALAGIGGAAWWLMLRKKKA